VPRNDYRDRSLDEGPKKETDQTRRQTGEMEGEEGGARERAHFNTTRSGRVSILNPGQGRGGRGREGEEEERLA